MDAAGRRTRGLLRPARRRFDEDEGGATAARRTSSSNHATRPRPRAASPRHPLFDPSEIESLAATLAGDGGDSGGCSGGGDASAGFDDGQRLQSLIRAAYQHAMERDMKNDTLHFETEAKVLREKIREKRRRVCNLLEMASDDEECDSDDDGEGTDAAERKVDGTTSGTKGAPVEGEDPFEAAIHLLRRETPGLERAVGRLVADDRSLASPSAIVDAVAALDARQQITAGKSEEPTAVTPSKTEGVRKTKAKEQQSALWQRRYSELEQYKQQHGHCNVPQKYVKNRSLGAWVARQRLMMRATGHSNDESGKDLLTSDRVERLRKLGLESSIGKGAFGKLCDRNTEEWEKQFEELRKFRKVHGHADVPTKKTSLGKWVARQRKHHREYLADEGSSGKEDQLRWRKVLDSRFQRLGAVGFSFHIGKGYSQPRGRRQRKRVSLDNE